MNEVAINQLRRFCSLDDFPDLPCPYCGSETLRIDRRSIQFIKLKNQFAEKDFEDINFESHVLLRLIEFACIAMSKLMEFQAKFSTFLKCTSCKETVIMVGKAIVPSELAKQQGITIGIRILPEFFTPPLPIIRLHSAYPKNIKREITRSFSTFFFDPSSCGNAIRQCIERLLDNHRIEKSRISKNGKQIYIPLSDRVELFVDNFSDAKLLDGIRFLGNEASHNSILNQEDVFNAYKILHYILEELYLHPKDRDEILKISQLLQNKYKAR